MAGLVALDVTVAFAAVAVFSDRTLQVLVALSWPLLLAVVGAYQPRILGSGWWEFRRVLTAVVLALALVGLIASATGRPVGRAVVLGALPLALTVDGLGRLALRRILQSTRRAGGLAQRVLVVGDSVLAHDVVAAFRRERGSGLKVVGACVEPADLGALDPGVPRLGVPDDVRRVVTDYEVDVVVVAPGRLLDSRQVRELAWSLEDAPVRVLVVPGLAEVVPTRVLVQSVSAIPLLEVAQPTYHGVRRVVKTVLERVSATLGLLLLLPVLVGVALAVRMTSPGPALFRQTRVGRDEKPFTCLKFRTMQVDAEAALPALQVDNERDGAMFKMRSDPRVTRVGRVLRRYSLDELPQLINVVIGDMALVGPRPPLPTEVSAYTAPERRRLNVRPGMTGLWQVSGRSDLTWLETVRLDLRYVDNWSLTLDGVILWKTARAVVTGEGAY